MNEPPIFAVESLACVAGYRPLFTGLHLSLAPGQWIELTGPNGTGKSTLLRSLSGLTRPVSGQLYWHAAQVQATSPSWRQHLMYQGHAPALKDAMTCAENLTTWISLDSGRRPSADAVAESLKLAGISNCATLPAMSLSAGQRRRVQLARLAAASERPLWLLDEPGNALDTDGLALLNRLIDEHLTRGGCAVVATHQPLSPGRPAIGLHMPDFAPQRSVDSAAATTDHG